MTITQEPEKLKLLLPVFNALNFQFDIQLRILALCCESPQGLGSRALARFERGNQNRFKIQQLTEDMTNS